MFSRDANRLIVNPAEAPVNAVRLRALPQAANRVQVEQMIHKVKAIRGALGCWTVLGSRADGRSAVCSTAGGSSCSPLTCRVTGDNPLIAMKMANEEYDPQQDQHAFCWPALHGLHATGCRKNSGSSQQLWAMLLPERQR